MRISDWSSDVCSSDLTLDVSIFLRIGNLPNPTFLPTGSDFIDCPKAEPSLKNPTIIIANLRLLRCFRCRNLQRADSVVAQRDPRSLTQVSQWRRDHAAFSGADGAGGTVGLCAQGISITRRQK